MDSFLLNVLASVAGACIVALFVFIFKRLRNKKTLPKSNSLESLIKRKTIQGYVFIPIGAIILTASGLFKDDRILNFVIIQAGALLFAWGMIGFTFISEVIKDMYKKSSE